MHVHTFCTCTCTVVVLLAIIIYNIVVYMYVNLCMHYTSTVLISWLLLCVHVVIFVIE